MSFQPSRHSGNNYAGFSGPMVHIEQQYVDPKDMGFFIAEQNEGFGIGSFLWSGVTLGISMAAFGISYHKNKSIPWAFLTGLPLVNVPALAYYTVTGETGRAWKAAKKSFA
jgi:hypothetical protein